MRQSGDVMIEWIPDPLTMLSILIGLWFVGLIVIIIVGVFNPPEPPFYDP